MGISQECKVLRLMKVFSLVYLFINIVWAENRPAWYIRIFGDNQTYTQPQGKEGTTNYASIVVRNLRWPGSTCVYKVKEII
jgi:hypothetical protein